jgi:hypothetical protein
MAQQIMQREEDKSLGDLFSELASETGTLVRQEVALAQAEVTQKAASVGKNVGYLAVGGFVGYAAMLCILAGVIVALGNFMPMWLSAILVGVVTGVIAYFAMIAPALEKLKRTEFAPRETVESIKEDAQWLKNQVS